jgi:hypothetical protein
MRCASHVEVSLSVFSTSPVKCNALKWYCVYRDYSRKREAEDLKFGHKTGLDTLVYLAGNGCETCVTDPPLECECKKARKRSDLAARINLNWRDIVTP